MTKTFEVEQPSVSAVSKGADLTLAITSLAFGGRGLAKVDGLVVFVEGAIPGQVVRARIVRKRKGYLEARVLEILTKSKNEVDPVCAHFGECGGCRLQNLSYGVQLQEKRSQVIESLEHIGGFNEPNVLDPLPSPDQLFYRNKMEYSFGRHRWLTSAEITNDAIEKSREFALGLHVRGRFDRVLDLDECHLQSKQSVAIMHRVKTFAQESGLMAYSTSDHTGFWRHLVVREGKNTGETLLNVVTADRKEGRRKVRQLVQALLAEIPGITTIVHTINHGKAQVAFGEEEYVLHGPGFITEKIATRAYRISADSFFQTNTRGAELLYSKVSEFAGFKSDHVVYDLYAGAATISLYVADAVQHVVAFEVEDAAIGDARMNCRLNQISNITVIPGDLRESLQVDHVRAWGTPDIVIVDPPRAGIHADVLLRLAQIQPPVVIYVSCNPTTFARDAHLLSEHGYELEMVQPVDMFPMTPHVETVARLVYAKK